VVEAAVGGFQRRDGVGAGTGVEVRSDAVLRRAAVVEMVGAGVGVGGGLVGGWLEHGCNSR